MSEEPVRIAAPRSRYVTILVAGVLLTAFGSLSLLSTILMWDESGATVGVHVYQVAFLSMIFLVGLSALGFGARSLLRPVALLVIDETGFVERFVGRVTWDEVEAVRVYSFMRTPFVGVFLRDPEAFTQRQPFYYRAGIKTNLRMRCAPVNIPVDMLPMEPAELVAIMSRFAGRGWR